MANRKCPLGRLIRNVHDGNFDAVRTASDGANCVMDDLATCGVSYLRTLEPQLTNQKSNLVGGKWASH